MILDIDLRDSALQPHLPRHGEARAHGPAALKIRSIKCRHGEIFPALSFEPQASSYNNSTHYSYSFACADIEAMSISAVASLRPVRGQCLRHATTGLLSVQVKSPAATVHLRAVVALRPQQKRHQSTSPAPQDKESAQGKPQITFRQFAGRALGVSLRNLVVALSPRGIRQSYRENPGVTTLNVLLYVSYYQDAKLCCSNTL